MDSSSPFFLTPCGALRNYRHPSPMIAPRPCLRVCAETREATPITRLCRSRVHLLGLSRPAHSKWDWNSRQTHERKVSSALTSAEDRPESTSIASGTCIMLGVEGLREKSRRWRLKSSEKCGHERLTQGTGTCKMRREVRPSGRVRCGAWAVRSAIKYQSFWGQVLRIGGLGITGVLRN